jgi:hypothetical protein
MERFKITKHRSKVPRSAFDKQQIVTGTRIFLDFSVRKAVRIIMTTQLPGVNRILN